MRMVEGRNKKKDFEVLDFVQEVSHQAVAFDFGDADDLSNIRIDWQSEFHLPYEAMWVEFTYDSDKDVITSAVLVNITGFACFALRRHKAIGMKWDLLGFQELPVPDDAAGGWGIFEQEQSRENRGFGFGMMKTVIQGITAMNCVNVETVETKPSSVQRMMCKKRKLPLVSTWTLHIKQERRNGVPMGGTHASPRVHLRRGHVRQFTKDKFTWVQPCIVRGKSPGMVVKDYALEHVA